MNSKGLLYKHNNIRVFFSNHSFTRDDLGKLGLKIFELQQVHGKTVLPAQSQKPQADGHYTSAKKSALLIKTADCIPAMLFDGSLIYGLHIGWRGLQKKILSHTGFSHPEKVKLWIGPHIFHHGFQLDVINASQLLKAHQLSVKMALTQGLAYTSYSQNHHFHLDVQKLLVREAQSLGIRDIQITTTDTYTSPYHFSHRRNRWRQGQNYSLIWKV